MGEVDYITGEMMTEIAMGITYTAEWKPEQMSITDDNGNSDECPVCYEPMYGKYVATTSCGHSFHRNCFLKGVIDNEYDKCFKCQSELEQLKRVPPTIEYSELD